MVNKLSNEVVKDKNQLLKDVLLRESQTTTGIGKGIAIPHAKSDSVIKTSIVFAKSNQGIEYEAIDDKPVNLLFLLAVEKEGSNQHLALLSKLSKLLMNENFKQDLLNTKTPQEVLDVISKYENPNLAVNSNPQEKTKPAQEVSIVAVTACPTGIAHTYMAQEALEKAAKKLNVKIKIETNGASGVENKLTQDDIQNATGVILAVNRNVEVDRFNGIILGGMMAIDMGGPFNKAAYVFAIASLSQGASSSMAAVMVGGMVPPLAIALATTLFKNKFTLEQREAGSTVGVIALREIAEGAIDIQNFKAKLPIVFGNEDASSIHNNTSEVSSQGSIIENETNKLLVIEEADGFVNKIKSYDCLNHDDILKTLEFAIKAHKGQKRNSGQDYITHPVSVASIVLDYFKDTSSIIAALLHDVVEDTHYSLDDISNSFGGEVAILVEGVTKLSKIKFRDSAQAKAENLRKFILSISKDIRILIIKLADRLHNLRTIKYLSNKEKQKEIALETLEIYVPLAERIEAKEKYEYSKLEMFDDEIFVFTPKGKVISLPKGSIVLDFAYAIHTDIGDTCKGAKINGFNIDHVATLRNARGENYPNIIRAAKEAINAGADHITAHLREDRRHIKDKDIYDLKSYLTVPLNMELAPTQEMVDIACKVKPYAMQKKNKFYKHLNFP
ncbi:UNVERIFIED_CONTAM: hypothetical protein PYX00_011083 [Menopon gallinae]|uniref:Putative GTP diphosphokinase RSH1, chloroplastic n=1 Tax=Menopon gallinae TaxID=328185 RepID=A0AAW2H5U8_9NEOP